MRHLKTDQITVNTKPGNVPRPNDPQTQFERQSHFARKDEHITYNTKRNIRSISIRDLTSKDFTQNVLNSNKVNMFKLKKFMKN